MEYISDKITPIEISKWKWGSKILISSQTGTGKSHFIKNSLYKFCLNNDYKCLLLSNRTILKNQNEEDLEGKDDIVTTMNYQRIENGIISSDEDLEYYFRRFKFIIFDEAHYLFSDSEFNRKTDLLLETLYRDYPDKIFLFMTATPEILLDYKPDFDKIYNSKKDYSYIEEIFFYNRDNTPESIIQNLPPDEKVIFFSSDAQEAYNLSLKFDDASFVCSESNSLAKYSDQSTSWEIIEKAYFQKRILCTTKVLDNGVSIIDTSVKHIIIDMLDVISFIQCLGRKRITSKDDKIKLYIKNYHAGNIHYVLMMTAEKIREALSLDEVGIKEFQRLHRKKSFHDIIDNDFSINKAKLQQYQWKREYLEKIKAKDGYKKEILSYLHIDEDKVKSADNEFEKIGINSYLHKIKGKKMFKEEQEIFKTRFFGLVFSPKNTNYRNRGINSINSILEEDNLPYRLSSGKETKGNSRNKRWWVVMEY